MNLYSSIRARCIAIDDQRHYMREWAFRNWCDNTVFPQAVNRAIEACRPVFPVSPGRRGALPQQDRRAVPVKRVSWLRRWFR